MDSLILPPDGWTHGETRTSVDTPIKTDYASLKSQFGTATIINVPYRLWVNGVEYIVPKELLSKKSIVVKGIDDDVYVDDIKLKKAPTE